MRRVAVRAIIEKNGRLLLVKLKSHRGRTRNDFYCTVGGGLDEGEGLVNGLKREVKEETGVDAEVGKLLCIQQFHDKYEQLEFFFHVTNADDFENVDISQSTHGSIEIKEIGFFNPREVYVLPQFLKEVPITRLLKADEPQIFNYL